MPVGAIIGGALPGLIQAGASLFGGGKRRREQKAAQAQFDADQAAVRNFQFKNPYANLENTAEDLTVNQQATNVQAAQTDAALAAAQENIVASGAGGGGGAAALVAGALGAKQNIAADIAGQESANQAAAAQQAAQNQQLEAQGEQNLQQQQFSQLEGNLSQSGQRLGAANAARQQATQALVSGLGSAAGGALGAGGAGEKGAGFFKNLAAGFQQAHSPTARLSPLKNVEGGPVRQEYKADRFERMKQLKAILDEGGSHAFGRVGDVGPGGNRFDQQYNIGGQTVRIDPTTGEFTGSGLAGKRAEEFFAKRVQGRYDQQYNQALKDAGLAAGFDPRGANVGGADAAVAEAVTRAGGDIDDIEGSRQKGRDASRGVYRSEGYREGRLTKESPTTRKAPLYKKKKGTGLAKLRAQCSAAGYKMVKVK